jgi:hypothetical protein
LKKDAVLHRALKLPEGEIIFREAVTESLSLHCPQPHTKPTSTTTTAVTGTAAADVTASTTAGATSAADATAAATTDNSSTAGATTGASSGTSTAGDTSGGSSTAMAVITTTTASTANNGNSSNNDNSSSNGGAAAVANKLSSMAVADTITATATDTAATSNNTEGDTGTSDSPATVDAPVETQRIPTAPIEEAPQLLLVPGHDCEPETFPAGLLFGAAHALPTAFVLERVLLASALRRAADLPCAVADTEVTVLPVIVIEQQLHLKV